MSNVTTNPSFPTVVSVSGVGTAWSNPNNGLIAKIIKY
jgi:hypothetical protein